MADEFNSDPYSLIPPDSPALGGTPAPLPPVLPPQTNTEGGAAGVGGVASPPNTTPTAPGTWDRFTSWISNLTPAQAGGLTLAGLTGVIGIGGVYQALSDPNPTVRQTVTRIITSASPEEQAAFAASLQGINQIGQVAFGPQAYTPGNFGVSPNMVTPSQLPPTGLAGQLNQQAPWETGAWGTGLNQTLATNRAFDQTVAPWMRSLGPETANMALGQAGALGALSNTPYDIATVLNPTLQNAMLDNSYAMSMGMLPSLNDPAIQARLNDVYNARAQDIDRYMSNAVQNVMTAGRERGFQGGMEVFNEGPMQALLAPSLAEATRQMGMLAGQRAQDEIQLAQNLPMQGAQLNTQQLGNVLGATNALGNIAGTYNTPLALRAQAIGNFAGTGQNLGQSLMNVGQQGVNNRLGFIGTTTAPMNAATNLGGTLQQGRTNAAGTTTTSTQTGGPGSGMMGAFGPLGSFLGGVGGLATGWSAINNPNYGSGFTGFNTTGR